MITDQPFRSACCSRRQQCHGHACGGGFGGAHIEVGRSASTWWNAACSALHADAYV